MATVRFIGICRICGLPVDDEDEYTKYADGTATHFFCERRVANEEAERRREAEFETMMRAEAEAARKAKASEAGQ